MPFQFPDWWSWKVTYAVTLLVMFIVLGFALNPFSSSTSASPSITASVTWGIVTLMLCLIFMLGAAQSPMQFLVFFGTGAFGAGMGYLVGAWLTPSGESNPLDQARNIVAGVLTGVVGTKLLTLWDDLVDRPAGGGNPPIMTAPFFVPVVMFLVGFTVSLSAFYTVRVGQSGDVRVTYSPQNDVLVLGPRHLGVLPDTEVNFAGAANSPVDVTVEWSFRLKEPCGTPVDAAAADKATLKEMAGAFETTTGKLKTPTQLVLQKWINSCPGSQNWILTATSKQDRSRFSQYDLKFCRTKQDCPATTDTKPATPLAGIPAPVGGPPPTPAQPASAPGTPAATGKQESKKADDTKTKEAK